MKSLPIIALAATVSVGALSACAQDQGLDQGLASAQVQERFVTSPSAHDVGTNSNYPLDPNNTVVLSTSPSASDRGTNSNYPLDPKNTVSMNNGSVIMPNNGEGLVQSANSMPGGAGAPSSSSVHVATGTSPTSNVTR